MELAEAPRRSAWNAPEEIVGALPRCIVLPLVGADADAPMGSELAGPPLAVPALVELTAAVVAAAGPPLAVPTAMVADAPWAGRLSVPNNFPGLGGVGGRLP